MDTARAYYKLGLNDRAYPLVKAVLRCMVNLTPRGGLVIRDINAEQPRRSGAMAMLTIATRWAHRNSAL